VSDRGFIDYAPRNAEVKARLQMMQDIIIEYHDELPLTMRQIFYRAVAKYGYEKTEAAYKRLLYISRKARRGGLISFADIRDDGVIKDAPSIEVRIDRGAFEQAIAREEEERHRAIDIIASADWRGMQ
jgi:hypothetical protein